MSIPTQIKSLGELKALIGPLEGAGNNAASTPFAEALKSIATLFDTGRFPVAGIHDFIFRHWADEGARASFVSWLALQLRTPAMPVLWINANRSLFPGSMHRLNALPEDFIFLDLKNKKDLLSATSEAMQCKGLSVVISEVNEIDFTAGRKLQLAAESSKVTGLILRTQTTYSPVPCFARWSVKSLPSVSDADMPGVGYPAWEIELLKNRFGKNHKIQLTLRHKKLVRIKPDENITQIIHAKTG